MSQPLLSANSAREHKATIPKLGRVLIETRGYDRVKIIFGIDPNNSRTKSGHNSDVMSNTLSYYGQVLLNRTSDGSFAYDPRHTFVKVDSATLIYIYSGKRFIIPPDPNVEKLVLTRCIDFVNEWAKDGRHLTSENSMMNKRKLCSVLNESVSETIVTIPGLGRINAYIYPDESVNVTFGKNKYSVSQQPMTVRGKSYEGHMELRYNPVTRDYQWGRGNIYIHPDGELSKKQFLIGDAPAGARKIIMDAVLKTVNELMSSGDGTALKSTAKRQAMEREIESLQRTIREKEAEIAKAKQSIIALQKQLGG